MIYRGIRAGITMNLRMLLRRRIVLTLLIVIPFVFLTIVEITSPERVLPFKLATFDDEIIETTEKAITFVFFAVASAGFLLSYLSLNIIQKNIDANRRLIICGFTPYEVLISKILALILIIFLIAIYIGILSTFYFSINQNWKFITGLVLIGFVYGGYGFIAGSIIKGELEGILLILLLVNIDVGWLQNPILYAEAQNQMLIRFLPAYYPSQTAIIATFTEYSIFWPAIYSFAYGVVLVIISIIIFYYKMRIKR